MYDGCFGLNRRPFNSVPQADQYFPAGTIENARTTLARCVQRGEGAGLIIGPSGTGKTLLCLTLAEQCRRSLQVVMLSSGRLSTRRALFQAILYELGRPYRDMDEGELRLSVVEHLTADNGLRGILLLVDEAHTLPLRLLEEIRLLGNLARNGQPLVRIVMAGNASLEERFASPKLDSFSQRLCARCYLEVLNRTETSNYIRWQIDSAGGFGEDVFSDAACDTVFQATGGVPRLINQVCDHALLLAYVAGQKVIEANKIEEAWSDLQQLPTPWSNGAKTEAAEIPGGGLIEFGSLDESPEESAGVKATSFEIGGEFEAAKETAEEAEETFAEETPVAPRVFRIASVEEDEFEAAEAFQAAEAADDYQAEIEAEALEPHDQLNRIETLLAEADEDFQPAGTIGPEIELHFEPEEAAHPFQEEFAAEEVVTDRYARKQATISVVIAPAVAVPVTAPVKTETAKIEPAKTEQPTPAVSREEHVPKPIYETAEEYETSAAVVAVVEPAGGEPQPQEPTRPAPQCPKQPSHREYRQLFSKLRRG